MNDPVPPLTDPVEAALGAGPSEPVRRDVVDGVPVFWTPGPPPLAAGLVFGVGRQDETFVRGGLTHLVEHLAMSAVGRSPLDCNASVDLTTTQFTAVGRPDRVVAFLRRICEVLPALPVDRLAVERDVLRTEAGMVSSPVLGALLAEQYGAVGPGLAGFREPALAALTAQDVQEWADTWFVRGAAALWLSGPPPVGLSLPLPDGAPLRRHRSPARPLTTPALVEHPVDGAVALGAHVDRGPALPATCRILRDRVEDDLRHRRGLSYTVEVDSVPVGPDTRFVVVTADCMQGQEALAARALWQGLVRLAAEGPTQAELAHEREALAELLADPRAAVGEVQAAAEAAVTGLVHRGAAELWQEAQALTPEQVRQAAEAIRDRALVGVPAAVDPSLPGLSEVPRSSSAVVSGRTFPRRRTGSDVPRGARLVVGDDAVSLVLRSGEQQTVRYDQVLALLQVDPRQWQLVAADGSCVPLAPRDWVDGERALELVSTAVPTELQVAADGLPGPTRSVLLLHAPPHVVAEALWPSRHDAWLAQNDRWSLVVREQDDVDASVTAAGISAALGRRHLALLLGQAFDELSVRVLHRGKEHDPTVLAEHLGPEAGEVAELLARPARPFEVLPAMVSTLGIPTQVTAVLEGTPLEQVPGLDHHPARGIRESLLASARGDHDPPDSTALHHRITRWERDRPPAYRALNAAAGTTQAVLAGVLAARVDGEWVSWTAALAGGVALSALASLRSARPPSTR